jgi:large subunit ribosomal protein L9
VLLDTSTFYYFKTMKVILKQDFQKLGKIGDSINVKDGYAMNYLIPNNIAMKATASNLKVLEEIKRNRELKLKKETADAEQFSAQLANLTLEIKAKAGDDEKIFGSITAQIISDTLNEKGFKIDKKQIELEEPIRQIGIFPVNIKLTNNVKASLKVWIIKEQA